MIDLGHFLAAQDRMYAGALSELQAGHKRGHWIWFVFPQVAGLGRSSTSRKFAIADLDEADAYLAHPVLGERLRTCVRTMLGHEGRSARSILGGLDAMKFRSSLTLFAVATAGEPDRELFDRALEAFFSGQPDERTLQLLGVDSLDG